ncbi:GIY-YIG nuclease family protein [bacterium]|nr:GIY-YIG nuclease family protein [bacterium]
MLSVKKARQHPEKIPEQCGVYIFRDAKQKPIYVGKARNLRKRLLSHFQQEGKSSQILSEARFLEVKPLDSEIEALLLEADLIKHFRPKYNVRQKDDRSFLYLVIREDEFPYVDVVREQKLRLKAKDVSFGPFVEGVSLREVLKALRKVFPFRDCSPSQFQRARKQKKPCLYFHLGKCPAPCIGRISPKDYREIIEDLKTFLRQDKGKLISRWQKKMQKLAEAQKFEEAATLRDRLKALDRLSRLRFIEESLPTAKKEFRIESFDSAHIAGELAVGGMVVYQGKVSEENEISGSFRKDDFRRFKLKETRNDLALLAEMLRRRFKHSEWPLPDLILVDGGENQLRLAKEILAEYSLDLPVVGILKSEKHKPRKPVLPFDRFKWPYLGELVKKNWALLCEINARTHRFAQNYLKILQRKQIQAKN